MRSFSPQMFCLALSFFSGFLFLGDDIFGQAPSSKRPRLIANADLELASEDKRTPKGFELTGDIEYGYLTVPGADVSGWGLRLHSSKDLNQDGAIESLATTTVSGLPNDQRWYRLQVQGFAQDSFAVAKDQLFLQVEFFKDQGRDSLDQVQKQIFPQVERERQDLKDPGTNKNISVAAWRIYEFDFRTPFPEVDTFKLGVGMKDGQGKGDQGEFHVDSITLTAIPEPASLLPTRKASASETNTKWEKPVTLESLVKLGGRWYFDPRGGDKTVPTQFDRTNVDRLYYDAGRLETPFAGNTTAWLREGWLDVSGKMIDADRFVPDNVIITFTETHLVLRSKNLPNHPTATFPDRWRVLDGNPNYIQEKDYTWHIPLDPQPSSKAVAMSEGNANRALNGGPIGISINGIVFFNPFDEGAVDAVWRLDRCCGHPAPNETYHYHKYPVCVNTPWADDGSEHSPLIGFAFDGFPVYGPYEAKGQMAKDDSTNPLNEFNIHRDDLRGWHYHVTPGRFPHVIGGYWGEVESKNMRRGPRPN